MGAKNQRELDKLVKAGERWITVRDGHFIARENSSVVARGNSSVEARENSSVVARGNSSVVAWGLSVCSRLSTDARCEGNVFDHTKQPQTVKAWLKRYSVKVKDNKVVLFKGTDEAYCTNRYGVTTYTIGEEVKARDWEEKNIECGNGLHLCPHPSACKQFIDAKHYLACEVALEDIRVFKGMQDYPDKVRCRKVRVLYEVDMWGEKIEQGLGKEG